MPKEQLILHWFRRGAINSLRQTGLHTSYLLSVELGACLSGGGRWGLGGGGVTLILSQQSTSEKKLCSN